MTKRETAQADILPLLDFDKDLWIGPSDYSAVSQPLEKIEKKIAQWKQDVNLLLI